MAQARPCSVADSDGEVRAMTRSGRMWCAVRKVSAAAVKVEFMVAAVGITPVLQMNKLS